MSQYSFTAYTKACFDLARSIIIKSDETAEMINQHDMSLDMFRVHQGGEAYLNLNDKTTWRYYRHMAGLYHPDDTFNTIDIKENPIIDKVIRVRSIDDYSVIEFTTENLKIHRSTRRLYQKGSTYYQKLVDANPDKRLLIDGILNPVDIHKAINAENHQILWYNEKLVEENEYSLIGNIQHYIDTFYSRWDNNDYAITDNLFIPAKIGILYTYLPYVIMGFRLEKARTSEVHSFHLWSYLGSHQWLDEYRYHLNLFQRLWFHRNIRWSEVNAGKWDTFQKHIDVVLTERNLPASEFFTHHDTSKMENNKNVMYPDTTFKREPLNLQGHLTTSKEYRDPTEMVNSEINEARDNALENNLIEDIKHAEHVFPRTPETTLPTKVIEVSLTNQEDATPIKRQDVEINHWIYMTTMGMYRARISILNSVENERMSMTQGEALIVWIYCLMKSYGLNPVHIPVLTADNVLRVKQPEVPTYRGLMDARYADWEVAYALKEFSLTPEVIISTERFMEYCNEVYQMKSLHRNIYNYAGQDYTSIYAKVMSYQFFETIDCKLTDKNMTFIDFFKSRGWDLYDTESEIKRGLGKWTPKDYAKFADDILGEATGTKWLSRMTPREVQGMMVRLLKKLSSYSIQLLRHYSDDQVTVIDQPYLRLAAQGVMLEDISPVLQFSVKFGELMNGVWHQEKTPILGQPLTTGNAEVEVQHFEELDYGIGLHHDGFVYYQLNARLPLIDLRPVNIIKPEIEVNKEIDNPWEMDKFRIHKTTEDISLVAVDEETQELIVRGVVYVKSSYKGKK